MQAKFACTFRCWLSLEDGTVWAFIGPVIAIITVSKNRKFLIVRIIILVVITMAFIVVIVTVLITIVIADIVPNEVENEERKHK